MGSVYHACHANLVIVGSQCYRYPPLHLGIAMFILVLYVVPPPLRKVAHPGHVRRTGHILTFGDGRGKSAPCLGNCDLHALSIYTTPGITNPSVLTREDTPPLRFSDFIARLMPSVVLFSTIFISLYIQHTAHRVMPPPYKVPGTYEMTSRRHGRRASVSQLGDRCLHLSSLCTLPRLSGDDSRLSCLSRMSPPPAGYGYAQAVCRSRCHYFHTRSIYNTPPMRMVSRTYQVPCSQSVLTRSDCA